jgi:fermentation-respiration switch protein FrsA (DUF1100 family)
VRTVLTFVLALVVGVLALKVLVSVVEPKLVFFPSTGEDRTPAVLGIRYETVRLQTSDGEHLVGWQLEPDNPIADVVYFHGNGGNLSIWLPILATLHHRHLRVLAVDYRGYGLSSGVPSEQGLYRDAEATSAHAVAARAGQPRRPLVYWGRSLGGPVAAAATRIHRPDGLILESTFAEKAAFVRSNPVLRALDLFARYRFPTARLLQDFDRPMLVVHARGDSIVPYGLGRELYEQLSPPKRFLEIEHADHNDLFDVARDAYWKPILDFIGELRDRI